MASSANKYKRGKRLKNPAQLPMALQLYLNVLVGTRPVEELRDICASDVFFQYDKDVRVLGIDAVYEQIAFRRQHLAGPPITIKKMLDHGPDDEFGHCVKVNFMLRTLAVAGKMANAQPGEPLYVFLIAMYYLNDQRITSMYETHWPELFRLKHVAS